jgi:hypothetical protein
MYRLTAFVSVLVAALLVTMAPAPTSAETFDKLANLTFNGRVQVPGVILNAGTYRFKLADPLSSRKVVHVLSHDGSSVYAMFYTIPDRRMEVTDEPVVTFRETAAGVPPVVRSLFYGGELDGYQFVYPGGIPIMTAEVTPQPPITYASTAVAAIPEPIAEPEPAARVGEPVAAPVTEPAVEQAPAPAELPRSASPLPLFAASGFVSLLLGLGAGLLRRRFN